MFKGKLKKLIVGAGILSVLAIEVKQNLDSKVQNIYDVSLKNIEGAKYYEEREEYYLSQEILYGTKTMINKALESYPISFGEKVNNLYTLKNKLDSLSYKIEKKIKDQENKSRRVSV